MTDTTEQLKNPRLGEKYENDVPNPERRTNTTQSQWSQWFKYYRYEKGNRDADITTVNAEVAHHSETVNK